LAGHIVPLVTLRREIEHDNRSLRAGPTTGVEYVQQDRSHAKMCASSFIGTFFVNRGNSFFASAWRIPMPILQRHGSLPSRPRPAACASLLIPFSLDFFYFGFGRKWESCSINLTPAYIEFTRSNIPGSPRQIGRIPLDGPSANSKREIETIRKRLREGPRIALAPCSGGILSEREKYP
jgi:hypothetical protein